MAATRTIKVLVVEDEPMILMAAVDAIEDAGYEALSATNADEAIGVLEREPQIRLVVTDIEMAGSMDGIKLAAYVRDRWPPVEIIITSGRVPIGEIALPARGVFMPKPYRLDDLTAKVGGLLAL